MAEKWTDFIPKIGPKWSDCLIQAYSFALHGDSASVLRLAAEHPLKGAGEFPFALVEGVRGGIAVGFEKGVRNPFGVFRNNQAQKTAGLDGGAFATVRFSIRVTARQ